MPEITRIISKDNREYDKNLCFCNFNQVAFYRRRTSNTTYPLLRRQPLHLQGAYKCASGSHCASNRLGWYPHCCSGLRRVRCSPIPDRRRLCGYMSRHVRTLNFGTQRRHRRCPTRRHRPYPRLRRRGLRPGPREIRSHRQDEFSRVLKRMNGGKE